MKITKEKVVYFLSLVLIPNLVIFGLSFILYLSCIADGCLFGKTEFKFFLIIFILSLLFGLSSLFYIYFKKEKYSIFINAIIISICGILIAFFSYVFVVFTENYTCNSQYMMFMRIFTLNGLYLFLSIFIFTFIFSLIILKITDPLRRKIKW